MPLSDASRSSFRQAAPGRPRNREMNNVVRTGGFVLIALGVLAILLTLVMGDSLPGLTLDSGATLLAGGFIALGLSTLAAAFETLRAYLAVEEQGAETFEASAAPLPRPFAES